MKLQIARGPALPLPAGLRTLHAEGALRVAGTPDVRIVAAGARRILFAGDLVGRRTAAGDLVPVHDLDGTLARLADRPLDAWAAELEGRYVVALLEGETASIACDRYGKRDLYARQSGGRTVVASDLDLIPEPAAEGYDQLALAHTLCVYGYRPPKRHTHYKAVRRLGIGEVLTLGREGAQGATAPFRPVAAASYGPRDLDRYAELFLAALEAMGSRDGNLVYLSSGWDSTAILAGLVHVFGPGKVRGVIGEMTYSPRSGVCNAIEVDKARRIAEWFGVRLERVPLSYLEADQAPAWIERATPLFRANHLASFTGISHVILADYARRTRQDGEAVFAGEISDGAHNLGFSQYVTLFHPVYEFREYADKMGSYLFGPTFLRQLQEGRHEQDAIYALFRGRAAAGAFDAPAADAAGRTRQLLSAFFLRASRLPLWSMRNARMLTAAGAEAYEGAMAQAYLADASAQATPETLYSWYLHLYNSFHWQSSTVAPLAVTAEANGFAASLPFWDAGLQDFLAAMPEQWGRGLDLNSVKYPLKWTLANRLNYPMQMQVGPHSYTYDIDPGFSHGFEVLYHSALTPVLRRTLEARAWRDLLSPDVFDLGHIDRLVGGYLKGEALAGAELADLTSLALLALFGWYR